MLNRERLRELNRAKRRVGMISRRSVFAFTRISIAPTDPHDRQVSSSRANCLSYFFFFIQRSRSDADHTRRGKCIVSSHYFERKYYRNAARVCTLYLHTSTTRSLISQARNNIWPCAIARVAVKIAIPRGIVSRCINDPLHHLRPRSIRRRPPLPATPVPFVCRLSREIGARSPFGNAPRIRLSSEERDNYRDKRNVDRSL